MRLWHRIPIALIHYLGELDVRIDYLYFTERLIARRWDPNGHSVLFTTAVDIINTLAAAQSAGRLKREFQRYLKPAVLIVDELGYLPIDKHGADLLFQIISQRYERAPMVITTNRAYKHWSQIFNNDSTLTSAILDRVLHHADTVIIEGKSFRMKDEIEE